MRQMETALYASSYLRIVLLSQLITSIIDKSIVNVKLKPINATFIALSIQTY